MSIDQAIVNTSVVIRQVTFFIGVLGYLDLIHNFSLSLPF